MNRDEILDTIRALTSTQGFYGRLLENLLAARDDDPDAYDALMTDLESRNLRDAVDLCIYLET